MCDIKLLMSEDENLPLRDVVFKTLREGILKGKLKPGERLMETHLADKLGVSRTPIREAIRMLELEGLVTMIPRRGAEVSRISVKDLKDVLEVRNSLESLAARLACERISEEEKEMLKQAAEDFVKSSKSMDANKMAEADVRFHDVILNASGNKQLIQLVNNMSIRMFRYRLQYLKDDRHYEKLIGEHSLIMNSILEGNSEEAIKHVETHIDNQEISVINQLDEK